MSPRQLSDLTLEFVLLALLDQKPMHGYELYQELCKLKGVSMVWNIKQALLYAILDKLEKGGYLFSKQVQGETYPPRKELYLTEMGHAALREWLAAPVRRPRDLRQEFLAKLIVAHRYGKDEMLALVERQEQTCRLWLRELEGGVSVPDGETLDEWLVLSYRRNREEAGLAWLHECRKQIEKL